MHKNMFHNKLHMLSYSGLCWLFWTRI